MMTVLGCFATESKCNVDGRKTLDVAAALGITLSFYPRHPRKAAVRVTGNELQKSRTTKTNKDGKHGFQNGGSCGLNVGTAKVPTSSGRRRVIMRVIPVSMRALRFITGRK